MPPASSSKTAILHRSLSSSPMTCFDWPISPRMDRWCCRATGSSRLSADRCCDRARCPNPRGWWSRWPEIRSISSWPSTHQPSFCTSTAPRAMCFASTNDLRRASKTRWPSCSSARSGRPRLRRGLKGCDSVMQLANDGLVLWYGTPDAPAPEDMEQASTNVTVTVGVQPPGPSNVVSIHYRVDGGALRVLRAVHLRTDYARRTQYFRARFPDFWNGEQVEYVPVLTCAGRSVPGPAHLTELPSVFHVPPRAAQPRSRVEPRGSPLRQPLARFSFDLEFVAQVTVRLRNQPEIIGSTPA